MPYQIGKVFSDSVYSMVDRARDRAAQHPGGISRRDRRSRPDTGLEEAMIRAQGRREEMALHRQQADRDFGMAVERIGLDREQAVRAGDMAEAKRITEEEEKLYKQASGEREFAFKVASKQADVLGKKEQRAAVDRRAGLEEKKHEQDVREWEIEQEALGKASRMESVTTQGETLKELAKMYREAMREQRSTGKVDRRQAEATARAILYAARFATSAEGKGLPADKIMRIANQYAADLISAAGGGSIQPGGVAPNPGLDIALEAEATGGGAAAPRLGGR